MGSDYLLAMQLRALRRWLALCTVLFVSLGLVAQSLAVADMDAKMMTAAAGEMSPSPGGCDGCGDDDGMPATLCIALCGGTVAVLPSVAPLRVVAVERPTPLVVRIDPGRISSPDPYPPRPSILS
ncbi:MAG: hypothetical protein ACREDZ_11120 [Kiloniellales bacterium]